MASTTRATAAPTACRATSRTSRGWSATAMTTSTSTSRRFLLGEYMGGAVALLLHRARPELWTGAVLVVPMYKISDEMRPHPVVVIINKAMTGVVPTWRIVPSNDHLVLLASTSVAQSLSGGSWTWLPAIETSAESSCSVGVYVNWGSVYEAPEMVEVLIDCVRNPAVLDWEVKGQIMMLKAELAKASSNPETLLFEALHSTGYSGALASPLIALESSITRLNYNSSLRITME